jgi:hypothetical protein
MVVNYHFEPISGVFFAVYTIKFVKNVSFTVFQKGKIEDIGSTENLFSPLKKNVKSAKLTLQFFEADENGNKILHKRMLRS